MSRKSNVGSRSDSDNLPAGWETVYIGDVVQKKVDQHIPSGSETIHYIDIGSVDNAAKLIADAKFIVADSAPSRARQLVNTGDVLVSMTRPNLNAVAVVPSELQGAIASTGFDVLRPTEAVLSDWLFLIVRSREFVHAMTDLVQGALYPAVRPADIRNYPIPLPPLPEQRRIVARLEALEARSRRAREKLATVPAQLAQARQSLLAAAFHGDLTADWREANGGTATWPKSSLATVLTSMRNGISVKPDAKSGLPILRISALRPLLLDLTDRRFLSSDSRDFDDYSLAEGDLLFTRYNGNAELVGACAVVPRINECVVYPDKLIRVRIDPNVAIPHFIAAAMSCGISRQHIAESAKTAAGQVGISGKDLKQTPIPLPPLSEQHEIVRRLTAAFAKLDAAVIAHAAAVADLDRLDQSLLARAFSGGLVPPEATPALAPATPSVSVQAQLYLLRFIPALLRAAGQPVPLADLNAVVALRFLPAALLLPMAEHLGGAPARAHFTASVPVAYEDGAFLAVMQRLRQANAIVVSPGRRGIPSLSSGPKSPPSTPAVDADARHLAPLLSRVPVERVEPILRRLQSAEVQEALFTAP